MPFDPSLFKKQFPLFMHQENAHLVYLDNAATTQRPAAVIDAIIHFYQSSNANTHRSSHRLARKATEMMERVRGKAARFLNAGQASEIIYCRGATEGLNLLASCLAESLNTGDEIILSTAEHHANLVPWQIVAQKKQLKLIFLAERNGRPDVDSLSELLTDRTKVISITAASNALGFEVDLEKVRQIISGKGIDWVVDAAQLAAHQRVDVQAIGCDFLTCSAHKFYGPTGIGLIYGRADRLNQLPPWQSGGEMIESVSLQSSTYASSPHRFETGTSSLGAIAGLEACFDFWMEQDREGMQAYESELTAYLHQELTKLADIKLLTTSENNVGIATFLPVDSGSSQAADLAHWLDERDIAVRVGHHCAMPLMDTLATGSTLRVSLAAYNTKADVDKLIQAIKEFHVIDVASRNYHSLGSDIFTRDLLGDISLSQLQQKSGWQLRYKQLMQWSSVIQLKSEIRVPENLVAGCETDAWLVHVENEGRHFFAVDSDSRVVKGLACVLLLLINGRSSAEISESEIRQVIIDLGFEKHLSPSRNNGFRALLDRALRLVKNGDG